MPNVTVFNNTLFSHVSNIISFNNPLNFPFISNSITVARGINGVGYGTNSTGLDRISNRIVCVFSNAFNTILNPLFSYLNKYPNTQNIIPINSKKIVDVVPVVAVVCGPIVCPIDVFVIGLRLRLRL